jgi:hypothetical protein
VPRVRQRRLTLSHQELPPMRAPLSRGSAIAFACAATLVAFAAANAGADAQTPAEPGPWKYRWLFGANLSQSSYSSNWSGGDTGSLSWVATSDAAAERQFSNRFNSLNVLQLAYGQTAEQSAGPDGNLNWDKPDKSSDMIAFESTGRFTLNGIVDPYLALRLDSQFSDEDDPIGRIPFNPVKLKETGGIARVLLKSDSSQIITRLGVGVRQVYGRSFTDPVTRAKDSFIANDGGIEWQTNAAGRILDGRVLVVTRLLVFQPLFYSESGDLEQFDALAAAANPAYRPVSDFWKATDVDLQATFSAGITKHIVVNMFVQWTYDKFDTAANVEGTLETALASGYVPVNDIEGNVRTAGQFKETLAVGITYRLF